MQMCFSDFACEYSNILEICKHGPKIPPISESDAFKLMERMKKNVSDVHGVTINHYFLAGPAGWKHFYLLLNTLLSDVNNTDISEINTVYACILFKGHNKDKSSDRSYRTISSCPVVAKGLDLYVRDLHLASWTPNSKEKAVHMNLRRFFSLKPFSILYSLSSNLCMSSTSMPSQPLMSS